MRLILSDASRLFSVSRRLWKDASSFGRKGEGPDGGVLWPCLLMIYSIEYVSFKTITFPSEILRWIAAIRSPVIFPFLCISPETLQRFLSAVRPVFCCRRGCYSAALPLCSWWSFGAWISAPFSGVADAPAGLILRCFYNNTYNAACHDFFVISPRNYRVFVRIRRLPAHL